ncbi:MAG: hypothetical protein AAF998_03350 [Bacteroidota bacterium]
MNLIRLLLYGLAGAGVVSLAVIAFASWDSRRMGKRLVKVLQRMEDRYLDFVRNKISLELLASNDPDIYVESVLNEAMRLLEPDLESLISGINSSSSTRVPVSYDAELLRNLALMAESVNRTRHNSRQQLSADQGTQLQQSLEKALRSDLMRRKMNLNAGKME